MSSSTSEPLQTEPEAIQHAARGHHPTSPSSLQAREACPCWANNNGPSTEASLRGTAQHEAAEKGELTEDLSDEEAAAVAIVTDIFLTTEAQFKGPAGEPAIVLKEEYLPVDEINNQGWEGSTGGFADLVIISHDLRRAKVLDWKFGKFAVEPAKTNAQGLAYAIGAVEWIRRNHNRIPESVEVEFVSPHIEERSSHTFTSADYPEMYARIRTIVARALLGTAQADEGNFDMANPTTAGCLFCGRLAECSKAAALFLKTSKKYEPLKLPEGDIHGFEALAYPERAKSLLQFSAVAGRWASEIRKRVTEAALTAPEFLPDGYYLQATFPRKVTDPKQFFDFLLEQGLPDTVVWEFLDLPITPVEKYISSKAPRGEKTTAVEEFGARAEAAGVLTRSATPTVSLRLKGKNAE